MYSELLKRGELTFFITEINLLGIYLSNMSILSAEELSDN